MSRGSEDESLTANTEHTAFLCLGYHIPQIRSTDFKKNIKRCNATPPCAPFSASGEPPGSSSARQGRHMQKNECTISGTLQREYFGRMGGTAFSGCYPPSCHCSTMGRTDGFDALAGNQPTPLKGTRLGFGVNASREPTGPSSARQGHHTQKNEQAQATPQCREYFGG